MQSAEIREQRPANHDVVKVRDDEIGIAQVHVGSERSHEQTGHATNREQADKAEPVKHRRVVRNRSFVKRRRPIENFDG